jgi:hypothetical protein
MVMPLRWSGDVLLMFARRAVLVVIRRCCSKPRMENAHAGLSRKAGENGSDDYAVKMLVTADADRLC